MTREISNITSGRPRNDRYDVVSIPHSSITSYSGIRDLRATITSISNFLQQNCSNPSINSLHRCFKFLLEGSYDPEATNLAEIYDCTVKKIDSAINKNRVGDFDFQRRDNKYTAESWEHSRITFRDGRQIELNLSGQDYTFIITASPQTLNISHDLKLECIISFIVAIDGQNKEFCLEARGSDNLSRRLVDSIKKSIAS